MSGKKRKHEGGGDIPPSPMKKSKGALRSERRRERLDATPKQPTVPLREPGDKPTGKRELKRLERRKQRKAAASAPSVESESEVELEAEAGAVPLEDRVDDDPAEVRRELRRQRKKAKKEEAHRGIPRQRDASKAVKKKEEQPLKVHPSAKWTLSDPAAGRFLHHDPIFVRDARGDEFLIAAVARELQVLSLETSLLVRTLPARKGSTIVGFAVESPGSSLVYVTYSSGGIYVWDWTNDLPAKFQESFIGDVKDFAVVRLDGDDEGVLLPYITQVDELFVIQAKDGASHRTKHALESIQALKKAEYILARGSNVVIIGLRRDGGNYTWVELPLTRSAICSDGRVIEQPTGSKKASKSHSQLQLAIGNEEGQIHLYDDLSSVLSQGQQALPAPRILHWHRSAVSSIKFSTDGNYLISGGKETVLVLWQLETGRKQYLPHLTSDIERITVNAPGDRYALQMGDNSIMVLSTAELKPVANFAGLQMQTTGLENQKVPAASLHPTTSKKLLLTVPPTQVDSAKESAPRPFLQTFDVRTARHVTRQALTRNNATDINVGPEDNAILPPDVVHLAIGQDGEWLATVDEWMPPVSDVQHLASNRSGDEEARRSRREVFLKIWHWDASQEIWTLSTRADSPHQRVGTRSMGAGRVLALVSDPVSTSFATMGEDNCVKIWKPRTRMRGGVAMKDAQDAELVEWACKRSVQLSSIKGRADSPLDTFDTVGTINACAAYSSDGSLLAVSSSTPTTLDESVPAVTFIETATGTIKSSNTGLSDGTTTITAIAFLERYFIVVTHKAAFVWDLVSETLMQKIKLPHTSGFAPQLAVNDADQMFALVTPAEREGKTSRVVVHSTRDTVRMWKQDFETEVVKVLSGRGSRGFTLLFADATVRTISPTGVAGGPNFPAIAAPETALALPAAEQAMDFDKPEDGVGSAGLLTSSSAVKPDSTGVPSFETDEDDRPVVRPEQLASIFDVGQSFAMPPVKDMFQDVVRLFGRKP